MSIWNLSGLLSHELGALLTHWLGVTEHNFDRLWLLLTITNLSSLLPLPFLGWLPMADPQAEIKGETEFKSLPPAEVFEHHTSGSFSEQPFLPDVVPEFIRVSSEDFSPLINGAKAPTTNPVGSEDFSPLINGAKALTTNPVGSEDFSPLDQ